MKNNWLCKYRMEFIRVAASGLHTSAYAPNDTSTNEFVAEMAHDLLCVRPQATIEEFEPFLKKRLIEFEKKPEHLDPVQAKVLDMIIAKEMSERLQEYEELKHAMLDPIEEMPLYVNASHTAQAVAIKRLKDGA